MGVVLLATICGAAFSYELLRLGVLFAIRNRVLNTWKQATGEVEDQWRVSSVGMVSRDKRTSPFPYDTLRINVRYAVSGVVYETSNVNLLDFLSSFNYSKNDDRSIQSELKQRGCVSLRYNPHHPGTSVVRPTIAVRVWAEVLIVVTGLVFLTPVYQWYGAAERAPSSSTTLALLLIGMLVGLAPGLRVVCQGWGNAKMGFRSPV